MNAEAMANPACSFRTETAEGRNSSRLLVDASQVTCCDGARVAFLPALRRRQTDSGGEFAVLGLAERVQHLLALFVSADLEAGDRESPESRSVLEDISRALIKAGE